MKRTSSPELGSKRFALRIFVCGYEQRATFVSRSCGGDSDLTVVLDYRSDGILNYNNNKEYFSAIDGVKFISIGGETGACIERVLNDVGARLEEDEEFAILFDVSSCSRSVMAQVLLTIASSTFGPVVTCCYALSAYSTPPNSELPSPISEPIVGALSGWSDDLSKPPCAVVGLGFEPGRALGCIDYLEIPEVRLLMPRGVDARFEKAVANANSTLIQETGDEFVLPYDVTNAEDTFIKLESLVHGLLQSYRPVLIPLGPKILAALSIILAIEVYPKVCVWRTSAGAVSEVRDQVASGEIAMITSRLRSIAP